MNQRKGHGSISCNNNVSDHPQRKANLISLLLFWWTNDLFKTGSARPLEQSDFWPLHENNKTCHLSSHLQTQWTTDLKASDKTGTRPRLWKSVMKLVSRKDVCIIAFAGLLDSFGRFLQPLFLGIFISINSSSESNRRLLCGCAVLMFLTVAVKSVAVHHCSFRLYVIGMRMKASLKGVIFMKIFLLGQHTLQEFTKGHVIDLVSNDVQRMEHAARQFFRFVVAIFDVSVVVPLLWYFLGWQALMGLIFLLFLVPFGACLSYWSGVLRRKTAVISDRRITLMNEVVAGIREVKTHAWEWFFRDQIKKVRREEIKMIRRKSILLSCAISLMYTSGVVAAFLSVLALAFTGCHLTPFTVFTLLSIINVLRNNALRSIGEGSQFIYEAYVSFDRIQEFLILQNLHWLNKERPCSSTPDANDRVDFPIKSAGKISSTNESCVCSDSIETTNLMDQSHKRHIEDYLREEKESIHIVKPGGEKEQMEKTEVDEIMETTGISVTNVTCKLNGYEKRLVESINLEAHSKSFTVITGPVGSGKSTLLSIISRLVPVTEGSITCCGTIAFVPQVPWIFSGTVRENIVFGQPLDEDKYTRVIKACALYEDIEGFPEKDQTVVGERGNTLSGGQMTRTSLARAVYADCDIYLLDDPLGSLDVKVHNHIFRRCIQELLSDKIRVLVSHREHHMKVADQVIVMHNGRITDKGSFTELQSQGAFGAVLERFHTNREFEINQARILVNTKSSTLSSVCCKNEMTSSMKIPEEDRMVGTVSCQLYWDYLRAGMHRIAIAGLIVMFVVVQGIMVSPDLWLTFLTKVPHKDQTDFINVAIYGSCVAAAILFTIVRAFLFNLATLRSSEKLHDDMTVAILKAPVLFFDSNPDGRILNRFSKDIGCMDEVLPKTSLFAVQMILFVLTAALAPLVANVWLAAVVIPIIIMYVYIARYYLKTAREIKRLEAVCRSPVLSHISETLDGLNTIRSRGRHREFIERFYRYQDHHNQAYYMVLAGNRWLGIRLDLLSAFLIGVVALVAALDSHDEALVGLALVYVFETAHYTQVSVQQSAEVENLMTSVERVMTFTKLDPEPGYTMATRRPEDWPNKGEVTFSDVSLRYYPEEPTVLKSLNANIDGNAKIGIAGRTGAGKSSILSALLRMPDADGSIMIDGVRLHDLNLQESRRCISVLSQSPVVFSGSLRKNLDPLEIHDDAELWAVLQAVHLKSLVANSKGQLHYTLTEKGTNLSVGERHLICLARVLLQNTKIVVLDEPTAHVDPHTENIIQETVRERLRNCTVITVAHRLTTIQDCDKILVLEHGELVEFDHFDELAAREGGVLASMIRATEE